MLVSLNPKDPELLKDGYVVRESLKTLGASSSAWFWQFTDHKIWNSLRIGLDWIRLIGIYENNGPFSLNTLEPLLYSIIYELTLV